jgi:hypothetical protein
MSNAGPGIMAHIQLLPTLATMADIYRLPRDGGATSSRFRRYVELVPGNRALAAYNPMAGPHALETTEQLLTINAETVAIEAARETVNRCRYSGGITLAVVLCAPGLWTDRLATEIEHRTAHRLPPGYGLILHWTRESPTAEQIRREAIAETVRVMALAEYGTRESVRGLLHREGLAYALGGNPYGPVTAEDRQAVTDAVEVLGTSEELSDKAGVLYGDAAAAALGWTQAGVAEHGGYRWAVEQAERLIREDGAPAALRAAAPSTHSVPPSGR